MAAVGRTWGEVLGNTAPADDHPALRTVQDPVAPWGALRLMRGSLAPEGCVMELAAGAPARHRARVVVFDGLEDLHARIDDPDLDIDADTVLVLRGRGDGRGAEDAGGRAPAHPGEAAPPGRAGHGADLGCTDERDLDRVGGAAR